MFLTLRDYIKLANRCYTSETRRIGSDDDIAMVSEYMMRADNKYRDGDKSKDSFRWYFGKFGVKACKKRRQKDLDSFLSKEKTLELDNIEDKRYNSYETLSFLETLDIIRQHISERDTEIFTQYYIHNYTISELASEYNISRQRVGKILKKTKSILSEKLINYV